MIEKSAQTLTNLTLRDINLDICVVTPLQNLKTVSIDYCPMNIRNSSLLSKGGYLTQLWNPEFELENEEASDNEE